MSKGSTPRPNFVEAEEYLVRQKFQHFGIDKAVFEFGRYTIWWTDGSIDELPREWLRDRGFPRLLSELEEHIDHDR